MKLFLRVDAEIGRAIIFLLTEKKIRYLLVYRSSIALQTDPDRYNTRESIQPLENCIQ